jgi:hypothetical protein
MLGWMREKAKLEYPFKEMHLDGISLLLDSLPASKVCTVEF